MNIRCPSQLINRARYCQQLVFQVVDTDKSYGYPSERHEDICGGRGTVLHIPNLGSRWR